MKYYLQRTQAERTEMKSLWREKRKTEKQFGGRKSARSRGKYQSEKNNSR